MRSAGPGRPSKGGTYAPGFVFAGIGLALAAWGLVLAAQRVLVVLSWPEAQAVVTDSRIETRGSQHAARIRVRFESPEGPVETEPAHDHRYSSHASIAEAVERFPRGGDATIRYHPEDPQRAWLEAGFNLATFGLSLLLIGVGAVFGGVGALALRSARLQRAAAEAPTRVAAVRAERSDVQAVALFVLAIGVAFLASGSAVLPGAIEARSWPVVSARVERGDVYSRSSGSAGKGGSATYYVSRLFVAYEHDGRSFVSPLDIGSSQDRQASERLVASIPKGAPHEIRVDPRRPNRISRADSWPLVFPAAFLATGTLVAAVAAWLLRR